MTPETATTVQTVAGLIATLSTWPNWAIAAFLLMVPVIGPHGLVIYLWWKDSRAMREMSEAHRNDTKTQLESYREDTVKTLRRLERYQRELKSNYDDNVELVEQREKDFQLLQQITQDQQGASLSLANALTELTTVIKTNQHCPAMRAE